MAEFASAIEKTLAHEGGFFHSRATGECVNRGITHWFLRSIGYPGFQNGVPRDVPASSAEIQAIKGLTIDETKALYLAHFWNRNRLSEIKDQALAEKVFDLEVNTGQGVRMLQQAINIIVPVGELAEDDAMGPNTLREANRVDPQDLLEELRHIAEKRYRVIAMKDPKLAPNLRGWLARLET